LLRVLVPPFLIATFAPKALELCGEIV